MATDTATVEVYESGNPNPCIKGTITKRDNEPNFVDAVGRFINQHNLSPNHLIEKWYANQRTIVLIKTNNPQHTEGTCF